MSKSITCQFNRQNFSQRGSSLIEILISVAVVTLILTTVAIGMAFSMQSTAATRYRSVAVQLANDAIEALKRENALLGNPGFLNGSTEGTFCVDNSDPDISGGFTVLGTPIAFRNCTPFIVSRNEFHRGVYCQADASASYVDLCTVGVSWPEGSQTRTFELKTTMAR